MLLESASVLSRLPSGLAQPLPVVLAELETAFPGGLLVLPANEYPNFLGALAEAERGGGAVYDGLVAATAKHHGAALLSLDVRARPTYRAVGVEILSVAEVVR